MTRSNCPFRPLLALLLAALFVSLALPPTPARADAPAPRYVPGEVLIGWQPGQGPVQTVRPPQNALRPDAERPDWQLATQQVAEATGLRVLDARPDYGTARMAVRAGQEQAEIERLEALPWVRYAEPNYIAYAAGATAVDPPALYPNDPDFPLQWHAQRVKAPEAWALTRGSTTFAVAVLDTGVALGQAEFAGKLLGGRNYIDPSRPPEDDDPESHGTHVAGILAANFNNGIGVAGLAPDVKILPLKVLDSTRSGAYSAISQAIRDAANSQAQVINMSLVGYAPSQTLHDAVNYAISRGRLVVAAGGNCAQNVSACGSINPTIYPAAYPGVLAVAASDRFDNPASYSGYKPYIGIAAPGGTPEKAVWSATRWGYGYMYGTSMSVPAVSAAAALAWTLRPAASPGEIAELLKSSADKVGAYPFSDEPLSYAAGRNDYFGAGRLNMANAVRTAYPPALIAPTMRTFLLGPDQMSRAATVEIDSLSSQGIWWQATVTQGAEWLSASPSSGTAVFGAPGKLTLTANATSLAPGLYFGMVQVTPLAPAGPPINVPVQLQVAAALARSFLPVAGGGFGNAWLDPDAPGSLYQLEFPLGNDMATQVVLPFPITFYGTQFQGAQISDNGLLTFGPGNAPTRAPTTCPGNGAGPNNAVYVFAADWVLDGPASLVVHQPDADTFVVTWRNARLNGTEGRATFQLAMTRDGQYRASYLALPDPRGGIIGSENEDGILAERILCQGAGQPAPLGGSLLLNPVAPWQ